MFARTDAFYAEAHEMLDGCLGDRAPHGLIAFFTGAHQQPGAPEQS